MNLINNGVTLSNNEKTAKNTINIFMILRKNIISINSFH